MVGEGQEKTVPAARHDDDDDNDNNYKNKTIKTVWKHSADFHVADSSLNYYENVRNLLNSTE